MQDVKVVSEQREFMATALKQVVCGPVARVSPYQRRDSRRQQWGTTMNRAFQIPETGDAYSCARDLSRGFEMHKLDPKPVKDTSHQSSPFEASSLGTLRVGWLEILCCSLVVGALLAIVATVYPHRDRPLPQWLYNLSINSLVSIYVVVLRAAMSLVLAEGKGILICRLLHRMGAYVIPGFGQLKWSWFRRPRPLADLGAYDDASTGPFGAVSLLWTLWGRYTIRPRPSCLCLSGLRTTH